MTDTRPNALMLIVAMQAATGTWNGLAPRGELKPSQHGKALSTPAAPAAPLPRDVRLGSARIDMLIAHLGGSDTAQTVADAKGKGACWFLADLAAPSVALQAVLADRSCKLALKVCSQSSQLYLGITDSLRHAFICWQHRR